MLGIFFVFLFFRASCDLSEPVEELAHQVSLKSFKVDVVKFIVVVGHQEYRFYLREKLSDSDSQWTETLNGDPALIRDYFRTYLYPPRDREYPDLCQLPDLNEETLMDNLRARFQARSLSLRFTY